MTIFLYKAKPSETFKYDDSMIWEQEAASSSLATPTMRSIIKGSEKVC